MVRAAWALALCACAAKPAPSMEPSAKPTRQAAQDPRSEIEQLANDIEDARIGMHLGELSPALIEGTKAEPLAVVPSSKDASCHPAQTETCSSSCTFSDSICVNAKRICDLSVSMAGDRWAQDKCKRASATCTVAHEKCCSCR